jgi:hypothetical protein
MWKINCLLIDLKMVHFKTARIVVEHYTVPAFPCKAVSHVESHSQLVRVARSIIIYHDIYLFCVFYVVNCYELT